MRSVTKTVQRRRCTRSASAHAHVHALALAWKRSLARHRLAPPKQAGREQERVENGERCTVVMSLPPASPSIPPRADPRFRSAKGNKGGKSRGFPSRPFSQLSRVSKFSKLRGGSHCPCLASTYLLLPRPTSLRCIQRHDLLTNQFLSTQDPSSPHLQCKRRIRGFGQ